MKSLFISLLFCAGAIADDPVTYQVAKAKAGRGLTQVTIIFSRPLAHSELQLVRAKQAVLDLLNPANNQVGLNEVLIGWEENPVGDMTKFRFYVSDHVEKAIAKVAKILGENLGVNLSNAKKRSAHNPRGPHLADFLFYFQIGVALAY
jgi:hypothetical protein